VRAFSVGPDQASGLELEAPPGREPAGFGDPKSGSAGYASRSHWRRRSASAPDGASPLVPFARKERGPTAQNPAIAARERGGVRRCCVQDRADFPSPRLRWGGVRGGGHVERLAEPCRVPVGARPRTVRERHTPHPDPPRHAATPRGGGKRDLSAPTPSTSRRLRMTQSRPIRTPRIHRVPLDCRRGCAASPPRPAPSRRGCR
jgi:hypothetical protein